MDNIKKFEDFLDRMQGLLNNAKKQGHIIVRVEDLENTFPELKESEDDDNKRISKEISRFLKQNNGWNNEWLTWLKKQGEPIDKEKVQIGARRDVALSIINFLDRNTLSMCLSDMERADLESAVVNSDWTKVYAYMKNKLEKQGEQKSFDYENAYFQQKDFAPKVEHLIPQEGMYYTCIKDYYAADNTHLHIKGNVYKSPFNGYVNNEAHLGLSWNSYAEKYFEPTKDEDWIVCEHDNVIGKPMQYKEFKNKEMQRFIENLKAQGLTPKLRLWNLLDAQNGDVLLCEGSKYGQEIGIVKEYIGKYGGCRKCFKTYCFIDWDGVFRVDEYMGSQNIHPATKEQRNTLMTAMAGAGYTFDFDKKVLKKIEKSKTW